MSAPAGGEDFTMKINPKKAALIGVAATTLFTLAACDDNRQPNVYGPAPDVQVEDNEPETVYGPPEAFEQDETEAPEATISPEDNEIVDVYGPPEDFE